MAVTSSSVEIKISEHVRVWYTTRFGGVSEGNFSTNNMGLHVKDKPKAVLANRVALEEIVGLPVMFMNQTHSSDVLLVNEHDLVSAKAMLGGGVKVSLGPDCDGMITSSKDFALAVLTADCLPLVLCTMSGEYIGAVHCGWKGVYGGIVGNAVERMRTRSEEEIIACIGPCIGPQSYEVSSDLVEKFVGVMGKAAGECFRSKGGGKFWCSLPDLVKLALKDHGVNIIEDCRIDTFSKSDMLYSYRKNHVTGRMATVIRRV